LAPEDGWTERTSEVLGQPRDGCVGDLGDAGSVVVEVDVICALDDDEVLGSSEAAVHLVDAFEWDVDVVCARNEKPRAGSDEPGHGQIVEVDDRVARDRGEPVLEAVARAAVGSVGVERLGQVRRDPAEERTGRPTPERGDVSLRR
jgi:hypothetical protein